MGKIIKYLYLPLGIITIIIGIFLIWTGIVTNNSGDIALGFIFVVLNGLTVSVIIASIIE